MSFSYRRASGFLDDRYEDVGLSGRIEARPIFLEHKVTTPSGLDLVALADMKNEERVRHSEDDTLIDNYIAQAVEDVEGFTGRALGEQTIEAWWKYALDYVWLPKPPHVSITSVTEVDDDGNQTTISASDYEVFGNDVYKIEFDNSIDNQLKIVFKAGYSDQVSGVPRWAKSAVQWQTKLYYDKDIELAIESSSGLAMPAYLACKNYQYHLPE